MTHSKQKGSRGELEVRDLLRLSGFEARRGQQFSGASGDPDVVHNVPNLHIEVKRVEQLQLHKAMEQSRADATEGKVPTVWHRRNGQPWYVTIRADNFLRMLQALRDRDFTR